MKPLSTPSRSLHGLRRCALTSAMVLAGLATPLLSQAQASTNSLVGWAVLGDVFAQDGVITLTTAFLDSFDDEALNLSGQPAVGADLLEPAAGVGPYGLDLDDAEFATEGSLVAQSFTVAAGDTLSFDWSFGGVEDLFQDHAFVTINGALSTLATRSSPGLALNSFSLSFAGAGTVQLALGVVDTADYLGVSTLSISNLQITPVPEPASLALLLAGLGLVGAAARRHQRH